VVNIASKYFHVLIYDIKHTSYNPLVIFLNLYCVLKTAVANKLLKGTASFGGDFRRHYDKQDIWTAFLMKKWTSIHTQRRS